MAQVLNRERLNRHFSLFLSYTYQQLVKDLGIKNHVTDGILVGGVNLDLEEKLELVKRNTQEIVTVEELRSLLETEARPRAYWGFECSG